MRRRRLQLPSPPTIGLRGELRWLADAIIAGRPRAPHRPRTTRRTPPAGAPRTRGRVVALPGCPSGALASHGSAGRPVWPVAAPPRPPGRRGAGRGRRVPMHRGRWGRGCAPRRYVCPPWQDRGTATVGILPQRLPGRIPRSRQPRAMVESGVGERTPGTTGRAAPSQPGVGMSAYRPPPLDPPSAARSRHPPDNPRPGPRALQQPGSDDARPVSGHRGPRGRSAP